MGNLELDVVWSHVLLVGSIKGISEVCVLVLWHPKEPRLHAMRLICIRTGAVLLWSDTSIGKPDSELKHSLKS